MNIGRFLLAAIVMWIVRVAMNATFYTQVVHQQFEEISAAHPGLFREVVPAYIAIDLLFALVFAFLFVKAGAALGGGPKAGAMLGVIVAILSPVAANLYMYYSVTYLPPSLCITDSVYHLIATAIQGAIAGVVYKA